MTDSRLVVVSNRLPVTVEESEDELRLRLSCGGLVSAMLPILNAQGGSWIGSTGGACGDRVARALRDWCESQSYSLVPVSLTAEEKAYFYHGCSNEIIWPLFHGVPSRCKFNSKYWTGYSNANERFADAVEQVWRKNDFVWVHDYHLMLLAQILRCRGAAYRLAYFHHIPFPPPAVFENLPWRTELLRALTCFDTIGFQTVRDRRNFVACIRYFLPETRLMHVDGRLVIRRADHYATVGNYPISVDFQSFATEATTPGAIAAMHAVRQGMAKSSMILGIDRLDYTKGIPERLTAFQSLLESHPELRGHVTMVQIVVPSREDIPDYNQLKLRIEMLVSKINGEYGNAGWVPVHYLHRCVSRAELAGLFRAAQIALVTPLRDGMNLVAKEFCATRVDNRGVLVLSEFAGAADELACGALLVNPYDTQSVAAAIFRALAMSDSEQRDRMESLRSQIREHDIYRWARSFQAENALGYATPLQDAIDALPCPA
jgi:alpha,alpha-trehalose-phosphate synthase [UDP-forming]